MELPEHHHDHANDRDGGAGRRQPTPASAAPGREHGRPAGLGGRRDRSAPRGRRRPVDDGRLRSVDRRPARFEAIAITATRLKRGVGHHVHAEPPGPVRDDGRGSTPKTARPAQLQRARRGPGRRAARRGRPRPRSPGPAPRRRRRRRRRTAERAPRKSSPRKNSSSKNGAPTTVQDRDDREPAAVGPPGELGSVGALKLWRWLDERHVDRARPGSGRRYRSATPSRSIQPERAGRGRRTRLPGPPRPAGQPGRAEEPDPQPDQGRDDVPGRGARQRGDGDSEVDAVARSPRPPSTTDEAPDDLSDRGSRGRRRRSHDRTPAGSGGLRDGERRRRSPGAAAADLRRGDSPGRGRGPCRRRPERASRTASSSPEEALGDVRPGLGGASGRRGAALIGAASVVVRSDADRVAGHGTTALVRRRRCGTSSRGRGA